MFRLIKRKKRQPELEKAVEATNKSDIALREVKSRTPEVRRIVEDLRYLRERNHFQEQLEVIMKRG